MPHANATALQVAAGILGGMAAAIDAAGRWAWSSRRSSTSAACSRSPGPISAGVVGAWSDWTPLTGRGRLFPEPLDPTDPWRFANVRVA